jgi:hypothetical protein
MNPDDKKRRHSLPSSPSASSLTRSVRSHSTGSASSAQSIVDKSPQMAKARRYSLELQNRQGSQLEPDARQVDQPEGTVCIGQRDVRIATGNKRRKYSFCGIRFGAKEFPTKEISLPVYKENNREKRYFSAVKQKNVDNIRNGGFQTSFGGNGDGSVAVPQNVGQYNSRGHIYFFNSESNARKYGQNNVDGDYAIIEFVMPEGHSFTPDPESGFKLEKLSPTQALRTAMDIPSSYIKNVHSYSRKGIK